MQSNNSQKQKLKPGQIMSWCIQVQDVVGLLNFDNFREKYAKQSDNWASVSSSQGGKWKKYVKWERWVILSFLSFSHLI